MPPSQPDGYFAASPSGNGNAVLVLHPWWGLNDTIKTVCNQLANAGFTAFAPDLYHGKVADTIADAKTLSATLNSDRAMTDVLEAAAFLREQATPTNQSPAVIGFSLGAAYALDLSVADPEHIRSVVIFYGTCPADYGQSKAEYLGHFAENDDYEPLSEVDTLEAALKSAGRPVTFHRYQGTGHWFFEPDRTDAYNPTAASLAWERTLAFLNGQLAS